ncbi:MAG: 2-hydroxyglutaryl-CoA dehydratase [Omnitrophica bacterium RIFCSPLOWO2_01_FULL_45_10]|nr:MAG: 2-hydroxyglutaryl-CoA dehydratase [Omnitrophica bacterium RIFCSPLOWO2_01_FULL_45_10]
MIVAGLDVGSLATKTVILDQEQRVMSYDISLTIGDSRGAAESSFRNALAKAGLKKDIVNYIVATGYGRNTIAFSDKEVTEITCHASGAHFIYPDTRTVLDIGGQDSKAIALGYNGEVVDFVMNDKCAAGTGRFIEVMAQALGVLLESMGDLSKKSLNPTVISSFCTVFAESEVVSLVAEGRDKIDIIRGIHEAIAERAVTLLNKIKMIEPVAMTGGVAKNKGVVVALENRLKLKISVPDEPQIVGALGAALIALRTFRKKFEPADIIKYL